jgi:chromosome segregation ATPase
LLDDKKITADEINEEIESLKNDLAAIEEEVAEAEEEQSNKQAELSQMNSEYEEITSIINQRDDVQKEYDTLSKHVEDKNGEIKLLPSRFQINKKNSNHHKRYNRQKERAESVSCWSFYSR